MWTKGDPFWRCGGDVNGDVIHGLNKYYLAQVVWEKGGRREKSFQQVSNFIISTPDFKSHQRLLEGVELLQSFVRRVSQNDGQQVVEDRLHAGQVPVKL